MTYSQLLRIIMASLFILVILFISTDSYPSNDFQYFGSEIDYWHEKKISTPTVNKKSTSVTERTPKAEGGLDSGDRFQWQKYLNPKNKDFFKEGDYTPPEPFMEIVRNPTDANLKMWFAYIDKKNELSDRLQKRMREYAEKNSAALTDEGKNYLNVKAAAMPRTEPSSKRFRFRLYFDSHCPHCKRMFGTLSELQSKGFYVEARQVDNDFRGIEKLPVPVEKAAPNEIKEKNIQSVPLLLIGDLEKKTVYRLTGFQTVSSIFQAIGRNQDSGGGKQ